MKKDDEIYREFGERLKSLRKERNLTQTQLAEAVGMTQSRIYKYEKGFQRVPMNVLQTFANYFEISMSELIGLEYSYNAEESEWFNEIKSYNLSNDEINDLMNYVRYIVTKRN